MLEQALFRVNDKYFQFSNLPQIKFSQGQLRNSRRSIVFGTYHLKKNEIKIHPILKDAPQEALDFVIYHEMLHFEDRRELLKRHKGDRVHTSSFKQRESRFEHYSNAQKILKELLHGQTGMKKLRGEALEQALVDSLQRLDQVLSKYQTEDEQKKGVKRGSKKRNE